MPPPMPPSASAAASAAGESIWKIGAAATKPRPYRPEPYTNPGVSPASPAFITVPRAKQPPRDPSGRPKGIIPRPRNLFPASKANKDISAATTPRIRPPQPAADPETRAFQQWKLAMAQKRTENLKEGLTALMQKKEQNEAKRKAIMEERSMTRNEALEAVEREDVRLTLPSVLNELQSEKGALQDPNREERLAQMKARQEEMVAMKKEERSEAITRLYNEAASFILTEAQLDAAINSIFVEDDLDITVRRTPKMPRISELLVSKARYDSRTVSGIGGARLVEEVAGALTGGKLPPVEDNHEPVDQRF